MDQVNIFCRQVRARSIENRQAMSLMHRHHLTGQVFSILRQELDSIVRAIYLLSITDQDYRNQLIRQSISGEKWTAKNSRKKITDREMVELATTLHGWAERVYRFGCSFIHLSKFHDYQERDPVQELTDQEKDIIKESFWHYHGRPKERELTLIDIDFYLPMVFEKVSDNLECYLRMLEEGKNLNDN